MVSQIAFFVEGEEHRTSRAHDMRLREVFHHVFKELDDLALSRGLRLQFRLYGSRRTTYERFRRALQEEQESYAALLVDSEAPVEHPGECWRHLRARPGDRWARPAGAEETRCQLMVQAVEAWLLADPDTLRAFYGAQFHLNSLPATQNVEEIPKNSHIPSLEAATKDTQKGRYHKVKHLALLLARLDMARVRARSPHCDRIFATLGSKLRNLP
jgi:hypothetical protein